MKSSSEQPNPGHAKLSKLDEGAPSRFEKRKTQVLLVNRRLGWVHGWVQCGHWLGLSAG